ncbi:MAG: nucleoside triphosphate pyrophosphohydrolase [Pseudomonadota bacterium]
MAFSPPLERRSITALLEIMQNLRDPEGGCPWDVAQTHESIAHYTLEEAYEVVDAIENGTPIDLKEELGDLLLQVVFHAQIASEEHRFNFKDVVEAICDKMIRRHPHVFENADPRNAEEQTTAWEEIKAAERAKKQKTGPKTVLNDVPVGLPALTRAEKLGKRASRVGFDWPDTQGVMDKIKEELAEVEDAMTEGDQDHLMEEVGDLLLSIANLTRHLKIDGETALRQANMKFTQRFQHVEKLVEESGKAFQDHSLETLESFWQTAKNKS